MRKFYLRAFLVIAVVSTLWFINPMTAYAETAKLTLTGTGSFTAAGGADYAYPYFFTVVDASGKTTANVPLMCISFDKTIIVNESWDADIKSVTDSATDSTKYKEAAWLLRDAITYPGNTTMDQDAAWYAFIGQPSTSQGANNSQLIAAMNFVAANPYADYSHFQIYFPVGGNQTWGDTPQTFIGVKGAPMIGLTPEPSNLILLGSGLALLAFGLYRSKVTA